MPAAWKGCMANKLEEVLEIQVCNKMILFTKSLSSIKLRIVECDGSVALQFSAEKPCVKAPHTRRLSACARL